jgi:alpha-maltose-1-phosphate synthase
MRVDLLTREYPPFVYGGAGVHVAHLAAHLRHSVDLRVHCFGDAAPASAPAKVARVATHTAAAGLEHANAAVRAMAVNLAMAEAAHGASVVHSHTWYANFAGHLAKARYEIPHVVTAHSLEPLRPWKAEQLADGYRLSTFMERTALTGADHIIAVSRAMARDVLRTYPLVDPSRVSVIHNGVDTNDFRPDHGTDYLSFLGVHPATPVVACVSRITPQKGLGHLLRAASHLPRDIQLVIVAQSADTPGQRLRFRRAVDEARQDGVHVTWVDGPCSRDVLRQLLTRAEVFVCPSIYEPLGIVNLEAMACATPVVGTATGGIPEVIVDGETGLLVPLRQDPGSGEPTAPDDFANDLAARVNELLGDPGRARRMGVAARRRAVEHFSWEAVADQVHKVYQAVSRPVGQKATQ